MRNREKRRHGRRFGVDARRLPSFTDACTSDIKFHLISSLHCWFDFDRLIESPQRIIEFQRVVFPTNIPFFSILRAFTGFLPSYVL